MTRTSPITDYELQAVIEELRKDGSLIREKARVLTEEGLKALYARMQDETMPTGTYLDIMKYLAEIGDLKPKQSTTPQQGPGFSITINIPQKNAEPITLTSVPVENDGIIEEVPVEDIPVAKLKQLSGGKDLSAGSDEAG